MLRLHMRPTDSMNLVAWPDRASERDDISAARLETRKAAVSTRSRPPAAFGDAGFRVASAI
ncbi:hypothetical protein DA075_09790 [Methylobacterium currus]|uniref:Uncharacterized protein n=1 Tax=Methylobacterium currus TaxID=2051553 RepID=A0A2R4WI07_9HYPH|nr:hypothetical protein DA075_09790 [Methylobacterium currus]